VKLTPVTVQYVNLSDVFEGNPFALQAFEDSGKHSYGDNDITLVVRDTMISNLKNLKEDEEEEEEFDAVIEVLEGLDASTYIDLEA
jgi:hypothetical protein